MPMIVDPSAPHVVQPTVVASPDGWLRALVDDVWAGVTLAYNADTPPSARNLVLSPSAEVDLTNTQTVGAATRTWQSTGGRYGPGCIRHTATGTTTGGTTWTIQPVTAAGTTVTASGWMQLPATGVTNVWVLFRSGGTTVSLQQFAPPSVGGWVRISRSYTLTAGQTVDRVGIGIVGATGTVWLADAMMAEAGVSAPSDYVDGSQPGCAWEGAANASPSIRATSAPQVADIRKVRIVRQDPGAAAPVPVRSADPAWAIEGAGSAYDHEAPLGVAVVYIATPIYADGSTGPESSLAVTVNAPPAGPGDVWIKSVDTPGISAQVTVTDWPTLTWSSRIDTANVAGSPFPAASQDVSGAPASSITIDAEGAQIEIVQQLLTTPGVLLLQTRPDYHRPDQYVLVGDVGEQLDAGPAGSRTYTAPVTQVGRPDTGGQPLRIPAWSWDELARRYATWDAVAASYSSWASLAVGGVL